MPINAHCAECDKTYRVRDDQGGKRVKCPRGHIVLVPAPIEDEEPEDDAEDFDEQPAKARPSDPTPRRRRPAKSRKLWLWLFAAGLFVGAGLLLYFLGVFDFTPASVKKLVAKVNDVSDADMKAYDQFMQGQFGRIGVLVLYTAVMFDRNEFAEIKAKGHERQATMALLRVVQDTRQPKKKTDAVVCLRAMWALGELGPAAQEAIPLLEELTRRDGNQAQRVVATVALEKIRKSQ